MSAMIGKTINERYQIQSELGQGGMGMVYRGFDSTLKRDIAVKILTKAGLGTEGRTRLLHEAQAIASLNHPNIVTVHDVGEVDSVPFIVMEHIDGINLKEQPPKDFEEIIDVARQVCTALEHAHKNGIIHRDLKPGNIILTPNHTAKLMDFGLARSSESHLTREGVILGTVSYIAPEQVLGHDIDQRADLYALGVMLYELSTGELPFQGDDPVAVISQHLHAPLIPPRVKNPDVPPGLDDLIVRLMKKDPEDRPASAAEVHRFLDMPNILDMDAPVGIELTLLDRIVRGQIIGRENEIESARNLWDKAQSSEGQSLLVSGEPGIGKTRLMREMVAQAEVSGGQALVGACYPEGNGPYEAFGQIIRQAFRRNDELQGNLSMFVMAELLTLSPGLKDTFPDVPENPQLEGQAQQQRLLESVVSFCRALSTRSPLLLVIEDLHWADGGTLSLFRHLARRTRRQRIMVLGTYREVELDQTLPFNQVLMDMNRERLGTRLKLERLSRDQAREMLSTLFTEEITPEFLDGIYFETDGNPFFIEEVSKALLESGKLYFDGERWHRPDIEDLEIPQSVRVAIQSRISKLPEQVRDILTLSAILGREFDFDTLKEACEHGEDTIIDALERAERVQLIEEVSSAWGGTFTFSHALIHATLESGLSGLRKRRLHRRAAEVIERLRPDDFEILAYQYVQADIEDKAIIYLRKVAEHARRTYANQDALRYYSQVLEIMPEDDLYTRFDLLADRAAVYDAMSDRPAQLTDAQAMLELANDLKDDTLRCKSLLALAEYYSGTEFAQALELASRALDISRSISDPVLEAHSLLQTGYMNWWQGIYQTSLDLLEDASELFQQEGLEAESARCLHTISLSYNALGDFPAGLKAAKEAVELSRAAGDKRQEANALRRVGVVYWDQQEFSQAIPYTERALAMSRQIGDRDGEIHALGNLGLYFSYSGKFEEGKRCILQSIQIAEEIGSVSQGVTHYYWCIVDPLGEYEAGLRFMQERYENARKDGNDPMAIDCHEVIRRIFFNLGQFDKRQELLQPEIFDQVERISGEGGIIWLRREKGMNRVLMGDIDAGLQILEDVCQQFKPWSGTEPYGFLLVFYAFAKTFSDDPSEWLTGLDDLELARSLLHPMMYLRLELLILSIQAKLHLNLGQNEQAHSASAEVARRMEIDKIFIWQEISMLTHLQVLRAKGLDEEADSYLQKAYDRVMLVAGKIKNESYRQSYLENVPWNREIVSEAKAHGLVS